MTPPRPVSRTDLAIDNLTYALRGPAGNAWVQKDDVRLLLAEVDPARARADHDRLEVIQGQCDQLAKENARLQRELADAAPYTDAGRKAALETAKREYYNGTCDDCSCCTTAQCREGHCPTNSIGDSICPCTCD